MPLLSVVALRMCFPELSWYWRDWDEAVPVIIANVSSASRIFSPAPSVVT